MGWLVGLLIVTAAVIAIVRGVDVRLSLLAAALALGTAAGNPLPVVQKFFTMLTREQFVVPICCAMGFAHVLRHTECDQHLVHLLVRPLQKVRALLIPGTVLVGFLVNIPVISQTSTAVTIGPVIVPLLKAARISPPTIGASLLLGCSIGGELFNPGAPEFQTVSSATGRDPTECVRHTTPLLPPQLAVATAIFWYLSVRAERRYWAPNATMAEQQAAETQPPFRVNLWKALVPLIPVTLLFLSGPPFQVIAVPKELLLDPDKKADTNANSRLIGAAMLVGVVAAGTTGGRRVLGTARAFFDGAGYAFTHIISVIVTAECFGKGVELIGLSHYLISFIQAQPAWLIPIAGFLPLAFAWVSGSGMASTQSLFQFFVPPARALQADPLHVGAVVSIGAAAGRTMSPVAAVTLMCAAMTDSNPFELVRRLVVPLLAATGTVVLIARWMN